MKDKPVILVVDNEPQNIELLEAYLVPEGYEILKAASGEEALGKLSDNRIDLILLDVIMPGMDGFEVIRRVRKDNLHRLLPIILVTILRETEDRVKGIEAGCDDFISHPVDKMELLARVRSLLKVKAYNDLMSNYQKELESEVTRSTEELRHTLENLQRDIIERKLAQEELKKSEGKFRAIFDNASDGMFLVDLKAQKFFMCNATCAKMLGYAQEEFSNLDIADIHPGEDLPFINEQIGKFSRGDKGIRTDIRFKRKDGSIFAADLNPALLTIAEKQYLLIMFEDITEWKRAEEALLESETKYRTLVTQSPDGIFVVDLSGAFLSVNKAMCDNLKYSEEEFLSMKMWDIVPQQYLTLHRNRLAALMKGESKKDAAEYEVKGKDGIVHFIEVLSTPYHEGKEISGFQGIARDITERKQTEEKLSRSEEKYRTIFENVQDTYYEAGLDGTILEVSPSIEIISKGQYHRDDLIGKSMLDFYSVGGRRQALLALLQERGSVTDYEVMLKNRDGSHVPCSISAKMQIDAHGTPVKIIGSLRDITERKQAEEAVRVSEEKFRTLFEESKDCIYISSADGKLLDINAAGIEMFGYSSKEEALRIELGRDLYVDSQQRAEFLSRMNQQGFVKDFEAAMKRKNGQKLAVLETSTAVRDIQGKMVTLRGTIRDVTKQRLLERQIGQAQKMESVGLLAGGIAHDFNNILGIILGHTAVVERAANDPERLKDSTREITTAVQRGASLVRQILTFARKSDAADEPIRVNATIQELAKMMEDTFPKSVSVSLKLDKTIPIIMMDQSQLHQALLNLFVNARDAITDSVMGNMGRGEIRIQTSVVNKSEVRKKFSEASASEYVCIAVSDTGKGMDEETKQKIYEPFFTTKEGGKGTGLGLSVVYGIIESHHGHIEVESEIGQGTTFRLYLPVTDAVATPMAPPAIGTPAEVRGKETILLVEDEENLLGLMKTALEREGYTVLTATEGLSAVKTFSLHKEKIALVVTDLDLPKLDGARVFASMKEIDPNVKIILSSGYLEPNMKSNLLRSGAKEFIQKPYSPTLVLRKIREILDASP